ncbi:MAG: hypothetical protein D6731_21955, partial [Planctomycetota bacterium]
MWVCLLAAVPAFGQQVVFLSPTDGTRHYPNSPLRVRVRCANPGDVQRVELYLDGVLQGTQQAAPYRWSVNTGPSSAWRTLEAVAHMRSSGVQRALVQIHVDGTPPAPRPAAVVYVGVDRDVTDFQNGLDYGNAGFWFPQFDASSPRSGKPTDENERNGLPAWAGPLTHLERWQLWLYPKRTFSQDGPCRSKGGWPAWNRFVLPDGERGLSGIVLDPHAAGNTSQTVNRIDLGPGTPASFYLRVVVDNTDLRHAPVGRIRARGVHNGVSIEPSVFPQPTPADFNGIADVYTFRFDGFGDGDFLKIQLQGTPGSANNGGRGGASFGGLLFDYVPPAAASAPPSTPISGPSAPAGAGAAPVTSSAAPAASSAAGAASPPSGPGATAAPGAAPSGSGGGCA